MFCAHFDATPPKAHAQRERRPALGKVGIDAQRLSLHPQSEKPVREGLPEPAHCREVHPARRCPRQIVEVESRRKVEQSNRSLGITGASEQRSRYRG